MHLIFCHVYCLFKLKNNICNQNTRKKQEELVALILICSTHKTSWSQKQRVLKTNESCTQVRELWKLSRLWLDLTAIGHHRRWINTTRHQFVKLAWLVHGDSRSKRWNHKYAGLLRRCHSLPSNLRVYIDITLSEKAPQSDKWTNEV